MSKFLDKIAASSHLDYKGSALLADALSAVNQALNADQVEAAHKIAGIFAAYLDASSADGKDGLKLIAYLVAMLSRHRRRLCPPESP